MDFQQAMATALTMHAPSVPTGDGTQVGGQIAIVGSQGFFGNGNSWTHTLPTHAAGQVARIMTAQASANVNEAPVLTPPAGWSEIDQFSYDYVGGSRHTFGIFERVLTNSSESNPSVTSDTSALYHSVLIVLSGVDTTEIEDAPYTRANHVVHYDDETIGNFVPRPITTQHSGSALILWNPLSEDGFSADPGNGFAVERATSNKGYRNYVMAHKLNAGVSGVQTLTALQHTGFSQQDGSIFTFAFKSVEP